MMLRGGLVAIALSFALSACGDRTGMPANTTDTLYQDKIRPSLALIITVTHEGNVYGWGTGFCVWSDDKDSYFVTDDHVIDKMDTNKKGDFFLDPKGRPDPQLSVQLIRATETWRWKDLAVRHPAQVIAHWFPEPDLALLKINVPRLPAVTVGLSIPVDPQPIAIAGFPYTDARWGKLWDQQEALKYVLNGNYPGDLSASIHTGEVNGLGIGDEYIHYDAPTDHGNSGGPLFDARTGDVYGLVEAVNTGHAQEGPGTEDSFATSMVWISPLLNQALHHVVKTDPSLVTTPALQVSSTSKRCSATLRPFAKAYANWANAHGRVKSMAFATATHQQYARSLMGSLRRFYSARKFSIIAAHDVKNESSATRNMEGAARRIAGRQDIATAEATRAIIEAVRKVNATDETLASRLSSPAALYASRKSEGFVRGAAHRLNAALSGCESRTAKPNAIADVLFKSLALITTAKPDGSIVGWGTAFCVWSDDKHSYFVTADHVVARPDPNDRRQLILAKDTRVMANDLTVKHNARVIRYLSNPDLVMLETDVPNVPKVVIAPAIPHESQPLAIAGFPYSDVPGWGARWKKGDSVKFINDARYAGGLHAVMHLGSVSKIALGDDFIQYDSETDFGNSGGPLFDARNGDVYGIVKSVITGDQEEGAALTQNSVATSMAWAMPFLNQSLPHIVRTDGKLVTTPALYVINSSTSRRCSMALRELEQAYAGWQIAHGRVKSTALAMAYHQPKTRPFMAPLPRFYSVAALVLFARLNLKHERSATHALETAIGRIRDPREASTAAAARAFLEAIQKVNASDRTLTADLSSAAALAASEKSEGSLQTEATHLNDAGAGACT